MGMNNNNNNFRVGNNDNKERESFKNVNKLGDINKGDKKTQIG